MANLITFLNYGLYFANPADGVAAQAVMGGLSVPLAPEAALALFPAAQFLVFGPPYVSSIPGTVDLGVGQTNVARTPSTVSTAAAVTTVHEVSYLNPVGVSPVVIQTDVLVDYTWVGTIIYSPGYVPVPYPGTTPGNYSQAVVTWTGNGAANRLIPTPFSLASGTVAIWGCGGAGVVGTSEVNFFRHNGAGMLGTAIMGVTTDPIVSQGVVAFETGGFRVTAGSFVVPFGNTNNVPYVAVVLRDTTQDRRYLRVGTYKNRIGGNFVANAVTATSTIFFASGGGWSPGLDGLLITDGFNQYRFTYVSTAIATITPAYIRPSGSIGFSFVTESPHVVSVAVPGGAVFTPTHLWVWGSTVAYKSFEFPGAQAVTLINGASGHSPVTDMLTALGADSFTVQNALVNGSVWAPNVQYDYMALSADATFLALHLFASFTGVGVGPPTVIAGIPFTPGLVFGRQGGVTFSGGAVFRGPTHIGTDSALCSNIGGGNNLPTGGVTAIGAGTVSFDIVAAPVGSAFYGWAFVTGSSPSAPVVPPGAPPPPVFPPGPPPIPPPPPPPVPPPGPPTNCPPCTTLTAALAMLASRLQDIDMVHWTQAELTRYLTEAQRTWNALTGEQQTQVTFPSVAGMPFYDLPTTVPAVRAYTITDTYMVVDLEYALMEPPTGGSWTGTRQFTFPDIISALQERRDQFLYESGMVVTRVVQTLAGPPASGRFALNPVIMTVRRVAFIDATGLAYPLSRDDEWSANAFDLAWPVTPGVPATAHPIAYSTGVTPPLQCQIIPPLSTVGTLDILAVTRAPVMGGNGPCLDPTVGVLLGVPDDWTWVVKFGALATLLSQQGVTYDPQRAAYCENRFRQGVQAASKAATVLAARVNGVPTPLTSVSEADQYTRSWQAGMGTPTRVLLAGQALVALSPPPPDILTTVTLDLVRNAPVAVSGTDCLPVSEAALEPVLAYAQHLALFKEGPDQLKAAMDLLERFYRAAGVANAVDWASSPNRPALQQQTQQDEAQVPRIMQLPPAPNQQSGGSQ